jgi:hypothetical protein
MEFKEDKLECIYNNYITNEKKITFQEFIKIKDLIKESDFMFDVKIELISKPVYYVKNSYVLEHQSNCNNYDIIKNILNNNVNAYVLTHYTFTPRDYYIYNIDEYDKSFRNLNYTNRSNYRLYNYSYFAYKDKYNDLDDFINKQKKYNRVLIKYPFEWFEIKANTRYNLYNYNEYTLINHPRNEHHISNIFNINMKLIDIDGTKEKWYDKLLTENNIEFNL